MSIFASRTHDTIAIPFDEPHTVTIRKLAGRHLEKAKQAAAFAAVATLKGMGGAKFQQELTAAGGGDPAAVAALIAKRQADPLNGLDRYTVLACGITAWDYEESLLPVAVVDEHGVTTMRILAIDDLDDQAADFLARAIVALSPRGDEASQKNA